MRARLRFASVLRDWEVSGWETAFSNREKKRTAEMAGLRDANFVMVDLKVIVLQLCFYLNPHTR
jgi:hypothetical protein